VRGPPYNSSGYTLLEFLTLRMDGFSALETAKWPRVAGVEEVDVNGFRQLDHIDGRVPSTEVKNSGSSLPRALSR